MFNIGDDIVIEEFNQFGEEPLKTIIKGIVVGKETCSFRSCINQCSKEKRKQRLLEIQVKGSWTIGCCPDYEREDRWFVVVSQNNCINKISEV